MIEEKHQDYIYLKENYYDNPKEIFIFLGKLIDKCSLKNNILDIGCARGEFLYYLNKIFTKTKFTGIDYSKNLIDEAKKNLSLFNNINFENSSGENFKLNKKYDVITLLGVLSYFDDLYKILENIELHLNDCGKVSILEAFDKLYSVEFQNSLSNIQNPYGNGCASQKIVEVLKNVNLGNILKKSFYDLKISGFYY